MRWLFVGEALVLRKARRISLCSLCYSPHAVLRVALPEPRTVVLPLRGLIPHMQSFFGVFGVFRGLIPPLTTGVKQP